MSVEDSLQILYPTVSARVHSHRQTSYAPSHTTQDRPTIEGCITPHAAPRTANFRTHSVSLPTIDAHTTPADLAQSFISIYQTRSAQINPEVLDLMANKNTEFLANQQRLKAARATEEQIIDASMRTVVETSFAAIEPYAAELNHKLARTEMRIACTAPDMVTEHTGNVNSRVETSYYRARISSKSFSIVIRGSGTTVNFYMLPVSLVMALSKSEDQFKPLMSFTATAHGAYLDWQVEGKPLTAERQERFCLLLFNHLLEQTREHLTDQSSRLLRA
jgi:hypothetical protein